MCVHKIICFCSGWTNVIHIRHKWSTWSRFISIFFSSSSLYSLFMLTLFFLFFFFLLHLYRTPFFLCILYMFLFSLALSLIYFTIPLPLCVYVLCSMCALFLYSTLTFAEWIWEDLFGLPIKCVVFSLVSFGQMILYQKHKLHIVHVQQQLYGSWHNRAKFFRDRTKRNGAEQSRAKQSGVVNKWKKERKSFYSMLFLSNQMANKYGGIDDDFGFFLLALGIFLSLLACLLAFHISLFFMQKCVWAFGVFFFFFFFRYLDFSSLLPCIVSLWFLSICRNPCLLYDHFCIMVYVQWYKIKCTYSIEYYSYSRHSK